MSSFSYRDWERVAKDFYAPGVRPNANGRVYTAFEEGGFSPVGFTEKYAWVRGEAYQPKPDSAGVLLTDEVALCRLRAEDGSPIKWKGALGVSLLEHAIPIVGGRYAGLVMREFKSEARLRAWSAGRMLAGFLVIWIKVERSNERPPAAQPKKKSTRRKRW